VPIDALEKAVDAIVASTTRSFGTGPIPQKGAQSGLATREKKGWPQHNEQGGRRGEAGHKDRMAGKTFKATETRVRDSGKSGTLGCGKARGSKAKTEGGPGCERWDSRNCEMITR